MPPRKTRGEVELRPGLQTCFFHTGPVGLVIKYLLAQFEYIAPLLFQDFFGKRNRVVGLLGYTIFPILSPMFWAPKLHIR